MAWDIMVWISHSLAFWQVGDQVPITVRRYNYDPATLGSGSFKEENIAVQLLQEARQS